MFSNFTIVSNGASLKIAFAVGPVIVLVGSVEGYASTSFYSALRDQLVSDTYKFEICA